MGFFSYATSKVMTESDDAERERRHRKGFQPLDDPHEFFNRKYFSGNSIEVCQINLKFVLQISETNDSSRSLLINNCHFNSTQPGNGFTLSPAKHKKVNCKLFFR